MCQGKAVGATCREFGGGSVRPVSLTATACRWRVMRLMGVFVFFAQTSHRFAGGFQKHDERDSAAAPVMLFESR